MPGRHGSFDLHKKKNERRAFAARGEEGRRRGSQKWETRKEIRAISTRKVQQDQSRKRKHAVTAKKSGSKQ